MNNTTTATKETGIMIDVTKNVTLTAKDILLLKFIVNDYTEMKADAAELDPATRSTCHRASKAVEKAIESITI
ncbi:MAG: hypothetical protein JRL30_00970 [Deltaproteobacteria bacterium]|nr:hypothetical protein [Deltaproteobacteria bacterium]